MAVDMFLKLAGVDGESRDKKRSKQIDILAWSWGMSQSGTTHMGGGGGAGKVSVQDISITKWIDKSSPVLVQKCAKGTHIDDGELVVRKAGDTPLEYLTIKMTDIMITSVSTGGSGGEDRLTENVTLNFAEFEVKYQEQDDKGAAKGGSVDFKFNIAENTST
jgi:type VI secretion system secreted protein Hcp